MELVISFKQPCKV